MDQLLTVIVQTSPIPSHPSTALLEALFRSFDRVDGLRECKIVLVADGCNVVDDEVEGLKRGKVSSDTACRYQTHLKRLQECIDKPPFGGSAVQGNGSVELLILTERHGSARAIDVVVREKVCTPLVMICQHDNLFVADAPLCSIATAMQENTWLKAVHFVATATTNYKNKVKQKYGIELQPRRVHGLEEFPLIPLVFWFGRTHVAQTDYYRDFVLNRQLKTGDHLEELLGETQLRDLLENGMAAHETYGNFVLDQGTEVLYHLSGRRARAVSNGEDIQRGSAADNKNMAKSAVSVMSSPSFTAARSCRAIVPGLEPPTPVSSEAPTGRFRQRCFHCGVKGHSYRYCPSKKLPETETIDLS